MPHGAAKKKKKKKPAFVIRGSHVWMSLIICGGLVPGHPPSPVCTKIHGCLSPLYKMAEYSQPSNSTDVEPVAFGGLTVLGPQFGERAQHKIKNRDMFP